MVNPLQEAPNFASQFGGAAMVQEANDPTMGESPSRPEIDAKLDAASARIGRELDGRFNQLDRKIDELTRVVGTVPELVKQVRDDNKYTRWTIILSVGAIVVAGLAALWTTQGSLLSAFQAGLTVKEAPKEAPKAPPSGR